MSDADPADNEKKPRATYSPLILLAIGIAVYMFYNMKQQAPETIPDMNLTKSASSHSVEPAAAVQTEEKLDETSPPAVTQPVSEEPKKAENNEEEKIEALADDTQSDNGDGDLAGEEPAKEEKTSSEASPEGNETLAAMIRPRTLGSDDAPVKIVEHASFTCPHCAEFHKTTFKDLIKDYVDTGKVQIIFVDFPLNRESMDASMVSRCVPEKSYFNFVRLLFETQREWLGSSDYRKALKQDAMIAGLSAEAFDSCISNEDLQTGIADRAKQAYEENKIDGVPTLVVNNRQAIPGNWPYEKIRETIDSELAVVGGE